MKLRRITITRLQRGNRTIGEAVVFGADIAIYHGWKTAATIQTPLGSLHMFRSERVAKKSRKWVAAAMCAEADAACDELTAGVLRHVFPERLH